MTQIPLHLVGLDTKLGTPKALRLFFFLCKIYAMDAVDTKYSNNG